MHGHCLACTLNIARAKASKWVSFQQGMGCCEGGNLNVVCNSSNDSRQLLRPLSPKLNANDPLTLHAQQAGVRKMQRGGEFGSQVPAQVSSRWNPTPKQLETLEDIYRRGTRTPTAEQIQHITSQLRKFGKIEGKNVFYWFQNHKARERQKRRRKIESTERERAQHYSSSLDYTKHVSGFHVEQIASSLCSPTGTITAQEPISMSKSKMVSTIRLNRWDHAASQCDNQQPGHALHKLVDFYSASSCHEANAGVFYMPMTDHQSSKQRSGAGEVIDKKCYLGSEDRTLELFPLHSDDHKAVDHEMTISSSSDDCIGGSVVVPANLPAPLQFFHFLPLKN